MCGRLNVKEDPLNQIVSAALGIPFQAQSNEDLRPTQTISVICAQRNPVAATMEPPESLVQANISWGIKPAWAKRILINAQAETVSEKQTFKKSFQEHRCVVPCNGWYEWCVSEREAGKNSKKTKYLFTRRDEQPVYMAAICVANPATSEPGLVTLTCAPDEFYRQYHHRLPLMIDECNVEDWISGSDQQAASLLLPPNVELRPSLV